MESLRVCAIVPAAGSSTRFGGETEKQFVSVLNRPVISYTISALEKLDEVTSIIVVVQEEKQEELWALLEKFRHKKVLTTVGGDSRHKSILKGLQFALSEFPDELDIIVVHDGARPVVKGEDVLAVARAAKEHGAAGLMRTLVSTIVEVDENNFLKKSLDRSLHKASRTPQAFQYEVLRNAYDECSDNELVHGTECLHLVQKYTWSEAKLLDSSDLQRKITYKQDLRSFEESVRNGQWKRPISLFHEPIDKDILGRFDDAFKVLSIESVSPLSYDGMMGDPDSGTYLFLKQGNRESTKAPMAFPGCERDCHKQLSLVDFEGGLIRNHVIEIFDLIHRIVVDRSPDHRRMCLVFLYEDRHATALVRSTRLIDRLLRQNHGEECNVSVNSAMFLGDGLPSAESMNRFLKELHFMEPGTCRFY